MKFRKCPRCQATAYEDLRTYAVCHDCQFNTVEGYYWERREPEMTCYSVSPKIVSKFESDRAVTAVATSLSSSAFTKTDRAIVHSALLTLPPLQRDTIILKFWRSLGLREIAKVLEIEDQIIKDALINGYQTLKAIVSANPAFSRVVERQSRNLVPTYINNAA